MEPNRQVLQPVEILFILGKRTPDTPDGMVWGHMVWYGMVWYVTWYWYECGMVWDFHSTVLWYWYGAHLPPRNGYPLGTLNQGIDVPHRYPKMGDWSVPAHGPPWPGSPGTADVSTTSSSTCEHPIWSYGALSNAQSRFKILVTYAFRIFSHRFSSTTPSSPSIVVHSKLWVVFPENIGQYTGNQDFKHVSCNFRIPWWPLCLRRRRAKGQPAWLGSSGWLVRGCRSGGGGPCCAKLLPVFQLRWVSMCLSTCFHLFSQIECRGLRLPCACGFVEFLLCPLTLRLLLRPLEMSSTLPWSSCNQLTLLETHGDLYTGFPLQF